MILHCAGCQLELTEESRVASISGSVMGDEYIESYYRCSSCGLYTLIVSRDRFDGDGELSETVSGPIGAEEGEKRVAVIRQCDSPYDKKCRCSAHLAYFKGRLD